MKEDRLFYGVIANYSLTLSIICRMLEAKYLAIIMLLVAGVCLYKFVTASE